MSNNSTARKAIKVLRGTRILVLADQVAAGRAGNGFHSMKDTLDALEYAEATLVAQRASGKSGLKAGIAAGFVPYGA